MSPEEGKCVEVDVSFDSQMFNFPEEGLKESIYTLILIILAHRHCKITSSPK